MIGAIVSGLVTEIEAELLGVGRGAVFDGGFEEGLLETEGALAQPVMLSHGGGEDLLGFRRRREFEVEVEEEIVVCYAVLGGEDDEGGGQAVTEIVVGDGGETGLGLRSGGELGVGAIGGKLCGGGHRRERLLSDSW